MNSQLTVEDLWKTYRTQAEELPVLRGVSFSLPVGVTAAISGASGSGKSTLLNVCAGLDEADQGSVRIGDNELAGLGERALAAFRRRIGLVFQFHHLLRDFTALENVLIPSMICGARRRLAAERASELLDAVGLSGHRSRYPNQLSGGERQRVAVARALAADPLLLLADEPTGNLDEANASIVGDLLFGLAQDRGVTLLVVTHDRELAQRAQYHLHLSHGELTLLQAQPL